MEKSDECTYEKHKAIAAATLFRACPHCGMNLILFRKAQANA